MLRLPLVVDLIHHERRVALDRHTPRAVVERQAQAEYQRVPLSGVVGSLAKTPDGLDHGAVAQLDNAGSRYRAGTLPATVEVDGRYLRHLGSIRAGPQATQGRVSRPINASSMYPH